MPLETRRLRLREWRDEDLNDFATMCADPAVMEYSLPLLDREAVDASAARMRYHFERHGYGLWVVELKDHGTFIGYVGLQRVNFAAHFVPEPPDFTVEVSWRLMRMHWGYGYATEAAQEALRHGFDWIGLAEIVAHTSPVNRRSLGVMRRLGMRTDPADDFDHPRVPAGNALRRHVLYRAAKPD
jgi:RimJ/RimL family protein N-acetyltransferase